MGLIDDIRALIRGTRSYASMREGGTKGQKELGAVRDLIESMTANGDTTFSRPRLVADDPPDCIADIDGGGLAAIEVTEFVNQDVVEHNERLSRNSVHWLDPGKYAFAKWTEQSFLQHVDELVAAKDGMIKAGHQYDLYVVLLHSDEPFLVRSECEEWLTRHSFGPYRTVDAVYFLFPYEPHAGYPYQQLLVTAGR